MMFVRRRASSLPRGTSLPLAPETNRHYEPRSLEQPSGAYDNAREHLIGPDCVQSYDTWQPWRIKDGCYLQESYSAPMKSCISCSPIDPDGLTWPSFGTRARKNGTAEERMTRQKIMRDAVRTLLVCIGEDPLRDGLLKTPERYAKALLFLSEGYQESIMDIVGDAISNERHNELVIVKNIDISSLCEHHLVPFFGKIHIGYVPDGRIIGLSKIIRIAVALARRLQVQERLTRQVAQIIDDVLKPFGVDILMKAQHSCITIREMEKQL